MVGKRDRSLCQRRGKLLEWRTGNTLVPLKPVLVDDSGVLKKIISLLVLRIGRGNSSDGSEIKEEIPSMSSLSFASDFNLPTFSRRDSIRIVG